MPARYVQTLRYSGGYKPGGTIGEQQAKLINIMPPCEPNLLPVQERYRSILKHEKFGGTCDIMLMAKSKKGQKDMLVSLSSVTQDECSPQRTPNPHNVVPNLLGHFVPA